MKKILIICFTDLSRDPRVMRQITALKDKYAITTVGAKSPGVEGVEFHPATGRPTSLSHMVETTALYWLGMLESRYWNTYEFGGLLDALPGRKFDLIIANEANSLPLAFKIAGNAKIMFDAHEYYPGWFEDGFWKKLSENRRTRKNRKFIDYALKRYLKRCDKIVAANGGYAEMYSRNFGVEAEVITNACEYADLKPTPVDEKRIRIIHHGSASPPRKIELMIEMMDHLDERFTLDLMMVTSQTHKEYMEELKKAAERRENVGFIEPVPMQDIVKTVNRYDIGLFLCPPTNLNLKYALPNKFFEYIQARLAVAIGPSPEMAKIANKYDCGIVAEDFKPETLAKELNKLTKEKIEHYKKQSDKAAHELTSEKEMKKLNRLVTELVGG